MSTFSEEIKARYERSEVERDAFGRVIALKRLRPSEAHMLRKLADTERPNLLGDAMIAACVRTIDDKVFAPPKTPADIDIALNALDDEGMRAAAKAWMRLMGYDTENTAPEAGSLDAAKNLPATPA